MREDDRVRVTHMIDAIESALQFTNGREQPEMESEKKLLFAVVRAVEIIGEAASKVSPEGRAEAPNIPWGVIVGVRNRLARAYFDVDPDIVWRTVTLALPPLLPPLSALLKSTEPVAPS